MPLPLDRDLDGNRTRDAQSMIKQRHGTEQARESGDNLRLTRRKRRNQGRPGELRPAHYKWSSVYIDASGTGMDGRVEGEERGS